MIQCEFSVSCAFTGHRPSKFPWKYQESDAACVALKKALAEKIAELAGAGTVHFLSGMSEGVDVWAAQSVLSLRKESPEIKLDCIIPFIGQADKWNPEAQKNYCSILDQADSIVRVNREYQDGCFLERNRYMVDHSAALIAVYNGERRGGTAMTVRYARKYGREIYIIDPLSREITYEPGNRFLW